LASNDVPVLGGTNASLTLTNPATFRQRCPVCLLGDKLLGNTVVGGTNS